LAHFGGDFGEEAVLVEVQALKGRQIAELKRIEGEREIE
jgi:hypothetical protein